MYLFSWPRPQQSLNTLLRMQKTTNSIYYPIRALHATRIQAIDNINQGHATNPKNLHPQDVQSESVRGAKKARKDEKNEGIDAANECSKAGKGKRPGKMGKGNPEKVGFVEQVGGASGSARQFEEKDGKK